MAFTQETVTQHKDAGKHSGTAAETIAKQVGLGSFSKKIGEFVNKFVGKKQKTMADQKGAAAPAPTPTAAAQPAPPTTAH